MTTTHTTGPWHYDDEQAVILTPDSRPVAHIDYRGADSLAQEAANGHLLAAAPELLRVAGLALEELQEAGRVNPLARPVIRALHVAIAAATSASTPPPAGG